MENWRFEKKTVVSKTFTNSVHATIVVITYFRFLVNSCPQLVEVFTILCKRVAKMDRFIL